MKKFWQLLLTAMLAVLLLAACGSDNTANDKDKEEEATEQDAQQTEGTAYPYTINDATGEDVTFEKAPETVVSLLPSNTEILFAIGAGDKVIGVTENDDYPAEAADIEKVGDYNINVEKIISLTPDVVFAHEMMMSSSEEGLNQIREAGIPVVVVPNATNFDETYETITMFGEIMDAQEKAETVVNEMQAKVQEITDKAASIKDKKRVFIETSDAPEIYAPGADTFPQQFLDMIQAENVVTEEGWVMISPEQIVAENPDVIIVMYSFIPNAVEGVKQRDGFDSIEAVKNDHVIQVDEDITSRTGPRLADGLEAVAKAVYPEVFGE